MVLHVLAVLFTYWSVSFNALVNYKAVTALADAEYVQVRGRVDSTGVVGSPQQLLQLGSPCCMESCGRHI